jgi:hypothetical protein
MSRARVYAERTDVPVDRSKAEIERLLQRAGATQFATLMSPVGAAIAFTIGGRNYRFHVTMPEERAQAAADQKRRQRWRALSLVIKAKLEAGRSGITTLETELLPYAVLPGGRTVADEALPALKRAYESGRDVPLLPGV